MFADARQMLALAATTGCVAMLAELMEAFAARAAAALPRAAAIASKPAARRLRTGTWWRWLGCVDAAAHGPRMSAEALLVEGISRCCGTHTSMAARGTI
jgi:hypothetical protein